MEFIALYIPIGTLYYTLGNLDPKLRSILKSIHLLGIAHHSLIKRYGIEIILNPVIEAVKKLEKASTYMHLHAAYDFLFIIYFLISRIRVCCLVLMEKGYFSEGQWLFFFSADNLAAWYVGGYKALASSFCKCQYCTITDDNMQTGKLWCFFFSSLM